MPRPLPLDDQITTLAGSMTLRAKSLIVTLYGDSILPHGGTVWLGSVIRLVEPLGLSARMVRTAVFRLVRDGWLTAAPVGRRSYYSLTPEGRLWTDAADRRIYAAAPPAWDGQWLLVLTGALPLPSDAREALRRDLLWQGFGTLAPHLLAHPRGDADALAQTLDRHGLTGQVVVMRAQGHPLTNPTVGTALIRGGWDLDTLAADYQSVLDRFRPLWEVLQTGLTPDPRQAFLIRTLLIHDYRRVLLRDPMLPPDTLPKDWPAAAVRHMCSALYRILHRASERHLMDSLETETGPVPAAAPSFLARFGGLPPDR